MVKITTVKDYISNHPFFEGLTSAYIDLIAGCGRLNHFEAGAFLFREGEEAVRFYLLLKGEVAIESFSPTAGPITIAQVGEGNVLGFSWLFAPYRAAFDVHVRTPVRAVVLDGACLRGKVEKDHELGYELMKRFTQLMYHRLQATRRQLLNVYGVEHGLPAFLGHVAPAASEGQSPG